MKDDVYTKDAETGVNDVQLMYDACPTEKELVWIGPKEAKPFGTGLRFEGYGYFNKHPEELIAFLEKHMHKTCAELGLFEAPSKLGAAADIAPGAVVSVPKQAVAINAPPAAS